MNKYVWSLAAVWALSLAACGDDKPKEKLCEKGNTSCEVAEDKNEVGFIAEPEIPFGWFEVGNGKCVVGYDGDCEIGQVCLSSKGTQKDLQGVCTDGQWDTNGKLVAVMLFETLIQDERRVGSMSYFGGRSEECFWACSMASVIFLWRGIGMAPATVTARIQGPNAQAEQLRASARGVEYGCVKANSTLEGRQQWTCSFPKEGWAGEDTLEPLELKLWTDGPQKLSWAGSFLVDTQPLAPRLSLEAHVHEGVLTVDVSKQGTEEHGFGAAWLSQVRFHNLEVLRDSEVLLRDNEDFGVEYSWWAPDRLRQVELPGVQPGDTLEVHATISTKDLADNEANSVVLSSTLVL